MHCTVTLRCVPEVHVGRDKAGKVHMEFERLQSGILPWHTSAQHERCAHTHLYHCILPLTVSLSSVIPASGHNLCTELENCKLSSRPWAVRSISLFATQTSHEQRDKDKQAVMLLQPVCRAGKQKNLNQLYLLKRTWLCILCVNQLSPSYVLLQDKTALKVKPEGSNKSFQYFQFTWQFSVHGKINCSEGSSVQDIYILSITLQLLAMYRLAENRHPI